MKKLFCRKHTGVPLKSMALGLVYKLWVNLRLSLYLSKRKLLSQCKNVGNIIMEKPDTKHFSNTDNSLVNVFNTTFQKTESEVKPLRKMKNVHTCEDYRLTHKYAAFCANIIEIIVCEGILKHIEANSILAEQRQEFRGKRSCETEM